MKDIQYLPHSVIYIQDIVIANRFGENCCTLLKSPCDIQEI